MASVEVLVRLDDETDALPLRDLAWEHVAPCGCTCGVANADSYGADQDAAVRAMIRNAEARRRYEAQGFVYRLARRAEVIERMKNLCSCTPQWGVEEAPIPEGHRWAHASGGRRSHLVLIPVDQDKFRFMAHAVPLCDGKRNLWTFNWDEYPTCTRCERNARQLAEEVSR